MTFLHRLVSMLRWVSHRHQAERELNDEMEAFVDMAAADRMRHGVTAADARRSAVLQLGGVEQAKERVRSARHGAWLDAAGRDVRHGLRMCIRNPRFSVLAILTLAIGVAGTTVMLALIQGVLLRPLPVLDQDRLIVAWKELRTSASVQYPFGGTEIEAVVDAGGLLVNAAGVSSHGVVRSVMVENGTPSFVKAALVTGAFFDVLGVRPALGRTITRDDDVDGAEHVLILSHGLWQRRYGGSREVLGRRVLLGEQPFTIVGVMPPDVGYPRGVEVWRTVRSVPATGPFGDAVRQEVNLVARLPPGATIAQATSELTALGKQLDAKAASNVPKDLRRVVRSFEDVVVGDVRTSLLALLAAVALVLAIACANAANLLLMRGESRRGELAVRTALGAGRAALVRQLCVESLVLALAAGAVGLAVTWWSLQALLTLVPDGFPRVESVRIDATVVLFTVIVAFTTALLAGLAPALLSMKADFVSHLRSGGGRGVAGSSARHGRRVLVVSQVALAVIIVAGAGLLIQSVLRLQSVDMGLPVNRLVLATLDMPQAKYAERGRRARFLDDVVSQLESVSSIAAATPVNVSPFTGQGWEVPTFTAEGQSAEQATANAALNLESIHPNYFDTFDLRLVRGRPFRAADREGSRDVAIVSEDVAAQTWPGTDPIGKRLKMGVLPDPKPKWYTVVGVAANTRYQDLRRPRPTLYLPAAQFQMTAQMLALRTTASLDRVASLARDRVNAVDPDVRVIRVAHFTEMLDEPLARPRFNAFLLTVFGIAALLLSTIGLYAVMATYVRQRDREIALRLALGATPMAVRGFVLAEALWLAGLGAVIGLAGAAGATRLLRGMLFEVDPLDPSTIIGAALLLMAASVLASYVPVRQATRVDATAVLRSG
ncbi:MAG: ADOP family duplicated permease [Vicinamibacterales bacterium]